MPLPRQEDPTSYGFSGKTQNLVVNSVFSGIREKER
jgi:hypothetical protein